MQINPNDTVFSSYLNVEDSAGVKHSGLTKREWFAGLALQGLIASDRLAINDFDKASIYATTHADKLIKWLNKTNEEKTDGT